MSMDDRKTPRNKAVQELAQGSGGSRGCEHKATLGNSNVAQRGMSEPWERDAVRARGWTQQRLSER